MNNWNWQIQNKTFLEKTITRCREKKIILPTFKQLKDPNSIPAKIQKQLETIDINGLHPLNLFRINWRNDKSTGKIGEINYLEIPREITGVKARIIGLIGKYFPTGAHKVGETYGCESNVKEIYDKCHELEKQSDAYLIFNQFDQFGNSIWHYEITGSTIETLFNQIKKDGQRLSGFVSATGSAGTIGAGDYLREKFPLINVTAAEALQCPTLFMNGFGAHRIEGIGDKHVPWIHNVKNTNAVAAIDDEQPLRILRLFNEPEGKKYLSTLGVDDKTINLLPDLGISSIANLLAAIKLTKYNEYNENDVIFTIFTDSSDMYQSRLKEMNDGWGNYSLNQAGIDWNVALKNQSIDYFKELSYYDKKVIHNLKYFTFVEQQGKSVE